MLSFIQLNNSTRNSGGQMVDERQKKVLGIIMAAVLLFSMYFVAREGAAYVNSGQVVAEEGGEDKFCVVIDAGHGGKDPGKVGVNGALEKDINLQISMRLKSLLEAQDVEVVMTREGDGGLYDENASNKKVQDMKRRIAIIEEAQPDIVVSVHQNSYHEANVHGAQVFYYNGSATGKKLADLIQNRFAINDPGSRRSAKGNDSYYLLKKTSRPIVIVEYCVSDRQTGL